MQNLAALIVVVLMAFSAVGLGRPIVHRLAAHSGMKAGEQVILSGLVGAMILSGSIWVIGSVVYDEMVMAVMLLVVTGLAVAFRQRNAYAGPRWPSIMPDGNWRALPFAVFVIFAISLVGCFAPPADHDSLRYHLTLAHRDLAWGQISFVYGWSVYEFFPPLGAMLTRMAYALGGPTGAQLLHLAWVCVAAGTAGLLAVRMGCTREFAWIAVLLLLSLRVSLNLASAASIEFVMTAYAGGAVLAGLAVLETQTHRSALLLGLCLGGLLNTKHQGIVFGACVMLALSVAALRQTDLRKLALLALGLGAVCLMPWLVQNTVLTGNPLFPAFHQLFGDQNTDVFGQMLEKSRTDYGLIGFLRLPWDVFVNQLSFDGLQFGVPILLVFTPFVFWAERQTWFRPLLMMTVTYVVIWYVVMPLYLRFLLPIMPILCGAAAVGAGVVFKAAVGVRWRRVCFFGLVAVMVIGQSGFLAATAARRVPVALGIHNERDYLSSRPFQWYAQHDACTWVMANLSTDENYLVLSNTPSFYCQPERAFPQLVPGDEETIYTANPRPPISPLWLARQLQSCNVSLVMMVSGLGVDPEPKVFAKHRYDAIIAPLTADLNPVYQTRFAQVFKAADIVAALRATAGTHEDRQPNSLGPERQGADCIMRK